MIELGDFWLQDTDTFNESRRKILRLTNALAFDEITGSRLTAMYSECCREALRKRIGLHLWLGLSRDARGFALVVEFRCQHRMQKPKAGHVIWDSFDEFALPGYAVAYRASKYAGPDFEPAPARIDALRAMLAKPSREELLRDLKSRNEALSRSEARVAAVLEGAPDALLMVDAKGCITYANSQVEKTFGYSREALLGQNIAMLVPLAARPSHQAKLERFFETPRSRDLGTASNLTALTKDGRTIVVDIKLSPLVTESGDQVIASVRDVTEQRKNQELVTKLSLVVEQSPVSVAITDTRGRLEYVNPAFCRVTGYSEDEVIGQLTSLLKSNKTPQSEYESLWRTISEGKIWRGQFINLKKSGEEFWESVSIAPIFNKNHEITHYVAVKLDITDSIRREEEIKRQRALLDSLINTLPLLVFYKDTQGVYRVVNEAYCDYMGLPRDAVLDKTIFDLRPREFAQYIWQKDQQVLEESRIVKEQDWRTYPDGRKVMFDILRVPFRDDDGKLMGSIAVYNDITERMRMEEAIRESEVKYRELVENASSIILKLDCSGNIVFFNEFAQQFFGYTEAEILGKPLVGTIAPPKEGSGRDLATLLRDLVEHPELYEKNENENICKDGRRVWISWTNRALYDEASGELNGLLCIGLDATERKKSQMERDEALEVISGSIRYASRIQKAILPGPEPFEAATASHFVVWKPRDVVGGDVYLASAWGDGFLFVLGDCTGHGVPGAFVTLIASGAISRARGEVEPGQVAGLVRRMHQIMQTSLNQHTQGGDSDDGMELGVLFVRPSAGTVCFVGARFPLFVQADGEIVEFKADKRGIGYRHIPFEQEFTETALEIKAGLRLYLVSDGLIDQIGGEKRRAFGKKRFRELLSSLSGLSMPRQGERIYQALLEYQGQESRRDDVSLLGMEF